MNLEEEYVVIGVLAFVVAALILVAVKLIRHIKAQNDLLTYQGKRILRLQHRIALMSIYGHESVWN